MIFLIITGFGVGEDAKPVAGIFFSNGRNLFLL